MKTCCPHPEAPPSQAPGRYCLATCYCTHCPHYEPMRRPLPRTITAAAPRNGQWATREEPTWIDQL